MLKSGQSQVDKMLISGSITLGGFFSVSKCVFLCIAIGDTQLKI